LILELIKSAHSVLIKTYDRLSNIVVC